MTIAELRSLAIYHNLEAAACARAKNEALAAWHRAMAQKLTVLADTFEACGQLLTNITGNHP